MKIRFVSTLILSLAATTILSAPVLAQEQPDPGHPRINQVDDRLSGQENNTNNSNLTAGQKRRDDARDQQIQRQEQRDAAKNGGHLTKREQRQMNREMNKEKREKEKQERKDRKHREEQHHDEHPAPMIRH